MVSDRSNGIYRSVVVALIGWLILVGNAQPISDGTRSDAPAAQSDQKATQHSDIASGISRIGNQLEAQNAKSDPYEKERNDREIRDLQAQENSAYWAGAMFWATLGALGLSVIGVGLVWTTFRETRKANELAAKFQRARLEPILKVIDWEHFDGYDIAITANNIGGSVATNAFCKWDLGHDPPEKAEFNHIISNRLTIPAGQEIIFSICEPRGVFPEGQYFFGEIVYFSVFGDRHKTLFCFRMERSEPRDRVRGRASRIPLACKPTNWPDDT